MVENTIYQMKAKFMAEMNAWKIFGKMVHLPGYTAFEIMHPAAKACTLGAGYTLNCEHCVCMKSVLIYQTQRQYSGHNIPLSHCTDHSQ